MRYLLILLATLSLSLSAWGQETPQEKVLKAASGLFPPTHRVLIADETKWKVLSDRFHLDTDNAFTNIETHITVLRGKFVNTATLAELRHVLGHEAGHVRCNCYDEGTAEFWARVHLY